MPDVRFTSVGFLCVCKQDSKRYQRLLAVLSRVFFLFLLL
jgi:hypothetical protein